MSDSPFADLAKRAFSLGLGMATLTKERAEEIIQDMLDKGEVSKTEARTFLKSAKDRGKELRSEVTRTVEDTIEGGLRSLRLGVQSDIRSLEKRVAKLEGQLARLAGKPATKAKTKKKPAKKSKKKAAARKPARKKK